MVLIKDGNSEMGAHVLSKIGNLIRLIHSFRSTAITNLKLIQKRSEYVKTCALCFELLSDINTMKHLIASSENSIKKS